MRAYTVSISADGREQVLYRTTNNAGTTSAVGACTVEDRHDHADDRCRRQRLLLAQRPVTLTFTPAAGPSGVESVEYKLGAGAWTAVTPSGGSTRPSISTNGENTVDLPHHQQRRHDQRGGSCTVKIDTTTPTITVSRQRLLLAQRPGDADLHACGRTFRRRLCRVQARRRRLDRDHRAAVSTGPGLHPRREHRLLPHQQQRRHDSVVGFCTVKIDTTTPTITVCGNDSSWHSDPVTLTFTPAADPSGVASVEYRVGSGAWTAVTPSAGVFSASIATSGENRVSYRTTNNAGTVSASDSCIVKIDTTTPTIVVGGDDSLGTRARSP